MSSTECDCHHGNMSRAQSEQVLMTAALDGSFLIRTSETIADSHILCVLNHGKIHKYQISQDSDRLLFIQAQKGVEKRKFSSLNQLIEEYMQRGDDNGLVCALKNPITKKTHCPDKKTTSAAKVHPLKLCLRDTSATHVSSNGSPHLPERGHRGRRGFAQSISHYFTQRFTQLDLSNSDGTFITALRKYAEEDVQKDAELLTSGGQQAQHLHKLIGNFVDDFKKEMETFFLKIDLCRELFGPLKTAHYSKRGDTDGSQIEDADFEAFIERLYQSRSAIQKLEKKATFTLKDLISHLNEEQRHFMNDGLTSPHTPEFLSTRSPIPPTVFETTVLRSGKPCGTATISVNLLAGQLFIVRPNSDVLDSSNIITADRIKQLVKLAQNNCALEIIFVPDGRTETHEFADARRRELFCQLLQQMKMAAGGASQPDQLSLFIGTWNMGDAIPPWNIGSWLKSCGSGKAREPPLSMLAHDLYVIGTQETAVTEKDWVNFLKTNIREHLAEEMHTIAVVTLWGIRLVVLVKLAYRNNISHVQQSTIKTGIANTLGNKGAVGVSFLFNASSLCFVCAHLSARQERFARRNQNFHDIMKGLTLAADSRSAYDMLNQFHHFFFFGDLNYRIEDLDVADILEKVTGPDYSSLLTHDQLRKAQQTRQAFVGFTEEEIKFAPTYRYERGSAVTYAWQKFKKTGMRTNNPSWCDRVLWRSFPEVYVSNTSYGCAADISTSDHKPVFASFDVGITGQYMHKDGIPTEFADSRLVFRQITAEIKTNAEENFKIEFQSSCMDGSVQSTANEPLHRDDAGCCIRWVAVDLPELQPIVDDFDFLDDQHIHLIVRTAISLESCGDGVLPLKNMLQTQPQPFVCELMRHGQLTGIVRGVMHTKTKDGLINPTRRRAKSYDLIYTDTDIQLSHVDMSDEAIWPETPSDVFVNCELPLRQSTDDTTADTDTAIGRAGSKDAAEDEHLYEEYDDSVRLAEFKETCSSYEFQLSTNRYHSVSEWLDSIHLPQHQQTFLQQGWDHLDFLNIITDDDLIQLKVTDPQERRTILDSIAAMNSVTTT